MEPTRPGEPKRPLILLLLHFLFPPLVESECSYLQGFLCSAVSRRGVLGMFPLHLAALSGFSDCCRKLLSSGTFTLATIPPLRSPLTTHVLTPHVRHTGFDIDTPDEFGRTCLHAAAAGGWVYDSVVPFPSTSLSLECFSRHT